MKPSFFLSAMSTPPLVVNRRPRVDINQVVHIKRQLVGHGQILVSKNQEVTPADIIGKSQLNPGFFAVNLAQKLGISNSECPLYLQKKVGSPIFKGELLAMKKGLFGGKVVVSPTDGIIDSCNDKTGELKLKFIPKDIPLTAGVFGIVDEVDARNNQVLIKTMAAKIFAILGAGRQREGILRILPSSGLTNSSVITSEMRQHILVVGNLIYGGALKKATSVGVGGVISGGINAIDLISMAGSLYPDKKSHSDVGLTLLVTEGYGPLPIGDDIMVELKKYDGSFVFLNGIEGRIILPSLQTDSILTLRKTVLPINKSPLDIYETPTLEEIKMGLMIRIVKPPFMGTQGQVMAVDQSASLVESGLSSVLLTVETKNRKIKVPYQNVELI